MARGVIRTVLTPHPPVLGGKPAIALIDANELSSMMELIHLLRSPANAKRLIEAIEEVKSGSGTEMTQEQFLKREWQTGAKV